LIQNCQNREWKKASFLCTSPSWYLHCNHFFLIFFSLNLTNWMCKRAVCSPWLPQKAHDLHRASLSWSHLTCLFWAWPRGAADQQKTVPGLQEMGWGWDEGSFPATALRCFVHRKLEN
jgi:hypothetical protein